MHLFSNGQQVLTFCSIVGDLSVPLVGGERLTEGELNTAVLEGIFYTLFPQIQIRISNFVIFCYFINYFDIYFQ